MDGQSTTFLMVMLLNILVSGVFIVVAIYFILILRDIKGLSSRAKKEGEEILDDVSKLRKNVKEEGSNGFKLIKRFLGLRKSKK